MVCFLLLYIFIECEVKLNTELDSTLSKVTNDVSNAESQLKELEMIEHSTVPLPENEGTESFISAEEFGFVQIDKNDVPEANSAEIVQISSVLDAANYSTKCSGNVSNNEINMNGNGISDRSTNILKYIIFNR